MQRAVASRGGHVDTDRWVAFMRAELAWREGDYAASARCAAAVLAAVAEAQAPWWESLRAQVKARLAAALLKQGELEQCGELLGEALDAAAAYTDTGARRGARRVPRTCSPAAAATPNSRPDCSARPTRSRRVRRVSPDAPPAHDAARAALARRPTGGVRVVADLGYEHAAASPAGPAR